LVRGKGITNWPVEDIPGADDVFLRVHKDFVKSPGVPVNAFRDHPKHRGSMSVNWEKYSTAEQCRQSAKSRPDDNAVLRMNVGKIREVPTQVVLHAPIPDNRAHSEVQGEKTPQVRMLLARLATWEIELAPDR